MNSIGCIRNLSVMFLFAAGLLTTNSVFAQKTDSIAENEKLLNVVVDIAEDGNVSEEKSDKQRQAEDAVEAHERNVLLNARKSPAGTGGNISSRTLPLPYVRPLDLFDWSQFKWLSHVRKFIPREESAKKPSAETLSAPRAEITLAPVAATLLASPEISTVSPATLTRVSYSVRSVALQGISISPATSGLAAGANLILANSGAVDLTATKSGTTSLADLDAYRRNLMAFHGGENVNGYPFQPLEGAGYTVETNGKGQIDTFWQTLYRTNGTGETKTYDSDNNFFAYTKDADGVVKWYDIKTGEEKAAGWASTAGNVAMFGRLGTSSAPEELSISAETLFVVSGITVGIAPISGAKYYTHNKDGSSTNTITTDPCKEECDSYVKMTSNGGTLVFQKSVADSKYNELCVDIFIKGSLELSGFKEIVVNDNVLVNKSMNVDKCGNLILDAPLVGGTVNDLVKTVYFERTDVTMKAANEDFNGNWYFGFNSTAKFDFQTASNNPFGNGDLTFRGANVTFAATPAQLKDGNVYVQLTNDVFIDGAENNSTLTATTRALTVAEASRNEYFDVESRSFNRFYRVLSGNLSDGARGVGRFIWKDRDNTSMTQKMGSWIFLGDNSGYGATNWYKKNHTNSSAYALWQLGASAYNTVNLGIVMPLIFGDGGEFTYKNADETPNYYAIAGYGGFTAETGTSTMTGSGLPDESPNGHTGIGFNYSNDVKVHNAIFGTIRVYHLGTGTLELTNKNNKFDAGIWVTNGGTLKVADLAVLGSSTRAKDSATSGGVNIVTGTLEYTGVTATYAGPIENKDAIVRPNINGTYETYQQKAAAAWGINVVNAETNLSFDGTVTDHYTSDYLSDGNGGTQDVAVRVGDFTKSGAGTLTLTAGKLITSTAWTYDDATKKLTSTTGTPKSANVTIEAGTLALTGTATLGVVDTVYMHGGKLTSEAEITLNADQRIYSAPNALVNGEPTAHEISINNGAGTLTLAGGTLAYEFTNLGNASEVVAVKPSWSCINLDGTLAVDVTDGEKSKIEFVFTNGAMFTQGEYKLLVAKNDLTALVGNLEIVGISALPGNTKSRQTVELVQGGGTVTIKDVSYTVGGTANELYAYVSPSTAVLHWNKTGNDANGTWEQKPENVTESSNPNWISLDTSITDTNFYENDAVVFCDVNHVGGEDVRTGTGVTHTVTIVGEVKPLQTIVNAENDNYIFDGTGSICGNGRLQKSGAGVLTIYTENKFTGGADISDGTVNALAETALGSGPVKVYETGTLNVGAIKAGDFGKNSAVVNNALSGAINLENNGIINIYGSNQLATGSTVNVIGGELHAFATGSVSNAAITISGGSVTAGANAAFDETNTITVSGTGYGTSARAFGSLNVTAENGLGAADVAVNRDGVIFAGAAGIGTGTISLNGHLEDTGAMGRLQIAADNALDGMKEVDFNGGAVYVAPSGQDKENNFDISGFSAWKIGEINSIFGIGANAALKVDASELLEKQTYILVKHGSGTLTLNVDAGEKLNGKVNFEKSSGSLGREDGNGKVIVNFGGGDEATRSDMLGAFNGMGTIRTEGGYGKLNGIAGETEQHVEFAANATHVTTSAIEQTLESIAKYKTTTQYVAGSVHIDANYDNECFYAGSIVTDDSASAKEVTISADNHSASMVISQNTEDAAFYGKITDGEKDGKVLKTGLAIASEKGCTITLANNNTSTGTLRIYRNATVQIGTGAGTAGNWAGAIDVRADATLKGFVCSANIMTDATKSSVSGIVNLSDEAGTVTFAEGGKLVLDLSAVSTDALKAAQNANGVVAVKIAAGAAISNYADFSQLNCVEGKFSYAGADISAFSGLSLTNATDVLSAFTYYTYDANAGTLLLAIPEPSLFGLLAGLGALALAGTCRRRK